MAKATKERHFRCPVCDKDFGKERGLRKKHVEEEHPEFQGEGGKGKKATPIPTAKSSAAYLDLARQSMRQEIAEIKEKIASIDEWKKALVEKEKALTALEAVKG